MLKPSPLRALLGLGVLSGIVFAASPAKVDFRRDVMPIFRASCIDCHGPSMQMNGFRLDRRRDAMRGGTRPVIGPGNAGGSRLYLKLTGSQYGPQMPPTGPLKPEQIEIIKAWIDQGAATAADAACKRGLEFLRNSQAEDGSWYVKRRAVPIQPHFESGFPYGRDQFISAAATNWAATALALASK